MSKENIVIFDIDGVLSDQSHRIELSEQKRWNEFNSLMIYDKPNNQCFRLLHCIMINFPVIFLTARPENFRSKTIKFLRSNSHSRLFFDKNFNYFKKDFDGGSLLMRPENNFKSSELFKLDMLKIIQSFGYNIFLALDDNEEVIKMYQSNNIFSLYHYNAINFFKQKNEN